MGRDLSQPAAPERIARRVPRGTGRKKTPGPPSARQRIIAKAATGVRSNNFIVRAFPLARKTRLTANNQGPELPAAASRVAGQVQFRDRSDDNGD